LDLRVVDYAALRQVVLHAETKRVVLGRKSCWQVLIAACVQPGTIRLKPKTGARETVTNLVKQGTVERVHPIQGNLLITSRYVYPRARGEPAVAPV